MATNTKIFCDLEMGKHQEKSTLGKRKFNEAFSENAYDDQRYGQHIDDKFFENNVGNNCSTLEALEEGKINKADMNIKKGNNDANKKFDVEEILAWCEYYLANRNMFKI